MPGTKTKTFTGRVERVVHVATVNDVSQPSGNRGAAEADGACEQYALTHSRAEAHCERHA